MNLRRPANAAMHPKFGLVATLLCAALSVPSALFAQSALYVSDGDRALRLVRKVDNRTPYVFEKGKFVLPAPDDNASGNVPRRYKLQAAEEFLPSFVGVRIIKAEFAHLNMGSVRRLDRQFQFTAAFTSNFRLSDVFFVIEFDTEDVQRKCFVQEVTTKDLDQARAISIEVPLPSAGTKDAYKLHVFSGGLEVFHSAMPRSVVEDALRKMVAKRIKDVREANPKPLTGPLPRYPEKLLSTKVKGAATVSCVIATDGQPKDIKVTGTSDPAFADAALGAMSEWWFVPKIVDGRAIESAANLPFEFAPPKA